MPMRSVAMLQTSTIPHSPSGYWSQISTRYASGTILEAHAPSATTRAAVPHSLHTPQSAVRFSEQDQDGAPITGSAMALATIHIYITGIIM